jgi:hypothetical protein
VGSGSKAPTSFRLSACPHGLSPSYLIVLSAASFADLQYPSQNDAGWWRPHRIPRERALALVSTEPAIDGAMKYALSWQHVLQIGCQRPSLPPPSPVFWVGTNCNSKPFKRALHRVLSFPLSQSPFILINSPPTRVAPQFELLNVSTKVGQSAVRGLWASGASRTGLLDRSMYMTVDLPFLRASDRTV